MSRTLNEETGKFYVGKNKLMLPNDPFMDEVQKIKDAQEAERLGHQLIEIEKAKQEEINSKLETLELMPMINKVIILPYPRNPYRQLIKGNIIVDYDGTFKNPDTGEMDKSGEFVGCAKVIEVGPECKYLQIGDDIYYDTRTTYPVPFMSLGYKLTSEPQVICVLNEGFKQRFQLQKVADPSKLFNKS